MPTPPPAIVSGSRVCLHLAIHLEEGTEALSTFDEAPLCWQLGDGTLAPGLEAFLLGLTAGTEKTFQVEGSLLFGAWNQDRLQWLASRDFPAGEVPPPGSLVAFDTPEGIETAGLIREISGNRVCVDFNHPLSRRPLHLRLRVLEVSPPGSSSPASPPE